jgi:hypothetical protein
VPYKCRTTATLAVALRSCPSTSCPDDCRTLEVLRHELSDVREPKPPKVPTDLIGAKAPSDLIEWVKSMILGAHGLPNGSIPSHVPEELIVRLPRCWYKDTTSRIGSVLFMPHFVALSEQSEDHGVVRKIEGCLARYLQSAMRCSSSPTLSIRIRSLMWLELR